MSSRPTPATSSLNLDRLPDVNAATIGILVSMGHFTNARKVDTDIVQTDGEKNLFSLRKRLIDCDELRAVNRVQDRILTFIYAVSVPSFLKPGIHLLPIGLVRESDSRLTEFRDQLASAVGDLVAVWPTRVEAMRSRLGDQFRIDDYPTVAELEAMFSVSWRYLNLGADDRLQTISPELFRQQAQEIADATQETAREIRSLLRTQALTLVSTLRDRLLATKAETGKPGRIHESTLENLRQFLSYEPHRNVTGDQTLSRLMAEIRTSLHGVDIEAVRDDQDFRTRLGEQMSQTVAALEAVVRPGERAIRIRGAA